MQTLPHTGDIFGGQVIGINDIDLEAIAPGVETGKEKLIAVAQKNSKESGIGQASRVHESFGTTTAHELCLSAAWRNSAEYKAAEFVMVHVFGELGKKHGVVGKVEAGSFDSDWGYSYNVTEACISESGETVSIDSPFTQGRVVSRVQALGSFFDAREGTAVGSFVLPSEAATIMKRDTSKKSERKKGSADPNAKHAP